MTLAMANATPDSGTSSGAAAQFSSDGRLVPPANYREWMFLSSGLDMSYGMTSTMNHSMFDNVFADPQACRSFLRTGRWPEGTLLVKEDREASEKGSINRSGKFQTDNIMGVEVHLKDSKRFPGGWGFFFFESLHSEPAQPIPTSADCYSCHQQHGAVDTTFVQFYPTLMRLATQKRTLSQGYRP
jgi:hypothetical protein